MRKAEMRSNTRAQPAPATECLGPGDGAATATLQNKPEKTCANKGDVTEKRDMHFQPAMKILERLLFLLRKLAVWKFSVLPPRGRYRAPFFFRRLRPSLVVRRA